MKIYSCKLTKNEIEFIKKWFDVLLAIDINETVKNAYTQKLQATDLSRSLLYKIDDHKDLIEPFEVAFNVMERSGSREGSLYLNEELVDLYEELTPSNAMELESAIFDEFIMNKLSGTGMEVDEVVNAARKGVIALRKMLDSKQDSKQHEKTKREFLN